MASSSTRPAPPDWSASKLRDLLREHADTPHAFTPPPEGTTVTGDLDLAGLTWAGPLRLPGLTFAGTVDLADAEIAGALDLRGCRFKKALVLRDARITGTLTLEGATLGTGTDPGAPPSLDGTASLHAAGLRVEGDVFMDGLQSTGGLNLCGLHAGGTVDLSGAMIGRQLNMESAEVCGNVFCRVMDGHRCAIAGDAHLLGARVTGQVDFSGAEIGGRLFMQAADVGGSVFCRVMDGKRCEIAGDADLNSARVTGVVEFSGATIGGQLNMQAAEVGGNVFCDVMAGKRCEITGDAWLSSARVTGQVDFSGAEIGGELHLSGARTGSLFCEAVVLGAAGLTVQPCTITKGIRAPNCTITDHARFTGLDAGPIVIGGKPTDIALDLTGSTVHGSLSLGDQTLARRLWHYFISNLNLNKDSSTPPLPDTIRKECADLVTRLDGGLNLHAATVDDTVTLEACAIAGGVSLTDAVVRADLVCDGGAGPTRCRSLNLESARIDGDALLRGLRLTPAPDREPAADAPTQGELNLNRATIGSRVRLTGEGQRAGLTGARMTARGATIDRLDLCGRCFGDDPPDGKPARIDLRRATIAMLCIHEPLPPADLRGVEIIGWQSGESPDQTRDGKALITFVAMSRPFHKGVYRAAEQHFRIIGDEIRAGKVHREMRRRDLKEGLPFLARPMHWVLLLLIGHGTRTWPLAALLLTLFVMSWVMVSPCSRVEPSEIANAATVQPTVDPCAPGEWGWDEGFWLAARYHLPLILTDAVDEWDPSTKPFHMPLVGWAVYSPQQWMSTMTVVNGVGIPLLVLSLTGYIRRTS